MKSWIEEYNLLIFQSLDSSNSEARRLYQAGIRKNLILWAKTQTSGRGRNERRWDSPFGNLYLSFLLAGIYNLDIAKKFSLVTIISLGEAVIALTDENININYKWPNDLLLDGKKLAGILLESININQSEIDGLIIGLGCNIESYPSKTSYGATCLREYGYNIEPADLLGKFSERFAYNKKIVESGDFSLIRSKLKEKIFGVGENITVKINNKEITAIFRDIDEEARAIIELADGKYHKIDSGELFFGNNIEEFTK